MKIAVIGATGRLGGAVAEEALRRGHQVTALSRNAAPADALAGAESGRVDITDVDALAGAIAGHDAVVASVTDRTTEDRSIIPASGRGAARSAAPGRRRTAGLRRRRRLAAQRAGRALRGRAELSRRVPARGARAGRRPADPARATAPRSTGRYLSPPPHNLVPGERTGGYRVQAGDSPVIDDDGHFGITFGDLASALVDELESPQFSRQRFTARVVVSDSSSRSVDSRA